MLRTPRPSDLGLFLLLSAIWSSSFLFTKLAVVDIPPLTLACLRCGIGALTLGLVLAATGRARPRTSGYWPRVSLMALVSNALPMTLMALGMQRIDSGLGAITIAVAPLTTLLLAHLTMRDESITAGKLAGMLLGLLGVVVLVGYEALGGIGRSLLGQAAMLGVAICFGVSPIVARGLPTAPLVNAAAALGAAVVLLLPLALWLEAPWRIHPGGGAISAVLLLGVTHAALATVIYLHLAAGIGATFVALNNYVAPPLAVLWGALALGETVPPRALLALGLIFLGISLANPAALRELAAWVLRAPRSIP